jgi:hypothetical protein
MAGPVEPVAVIRALVLQTVMPELPLHEGASFVARVASRGQEGAASLVVAGELLAATVPEEVQTGQTLRLTVADVSPERVTLRMEPAQQQQPQPPAQAAPPPPPQLQAPRVRVEDRPGGRRSAAGEDAVTVVLDTPSLGTLRVRVATTPGSVSATVQVAPAALARAQARADVLRSGLAAQVGRPATVSVVPGAVDVRA